MNILHTVFGQGNDLNELQMGCRAVLLFFITLAIIRLAGMRTFGKKSAFDDIMVIMLGAVLSRAITGASPFLPVIVAGLLLAVVHKTVAWITVENNSVGKFLKGEKKLLFAKGVWHIKNMKDCTISKEDVMEEIRTSLHQHTLQNVDEIYIETSGKISLITNLETN